MGFTSVIHGIGKIDNNTLYIKREDLLPFSFGGNKARKVICFFDEILRGDYDTVVTYGSSSSNHCRVVANACAKYKLKCYIVSPEENYSETFNSLLVQRFGAKIIKAPLDEIPQTIDATMQKLSENSKPYFIQGGGHGNLGTQAYVDCYEEICQFEKDNRLYFDYIFHASGTGTTQAGLVCGQLINRDERIIVGVSIARNCNRGRSVVIKSISEYLSEHNVTVSKEKIEAATVFIDDYVGGGYGVFSAEIRDTIDEIMINNGVPLDPTYTAKAFAGMIDYIKANVISGKNILFLHTGGTPLYFDYLNKSTT